MRYVINVACFDCMILCFKLLGRTYTRYDEYENYVCAVVVQESICRCNAYRKRVNAKVRNYDFRDLDNEMNRKA